MYKTVNLQIKYEKLVILCKKKNIYQYFSTDGKCISGFFCIFAYSKKHLQMYNLCQKMSVFRDFFVQRSYICSKLSLSINRNNSYA